MEKGFPQLGGSAEVESGDLFRSHHGLCPA